MATLFARVVCADRSGKESEVAAVIGNAATAVHVDLGVSGQAQHMIASAEKSGRSDDAAARADRGELRYRTRMLPILYSFRRCPYAMRARLALDASAQACELREVVLKHKPDAMLQASPKGTVPVLIVSDGTVIDESLDIMTWALDRNDPEQWLTPEMESHTQMLSLVRQFDTHFKFHLDRYKYPTRYADADADASRDEASADLQSLEVRLTGTRWLYGERTALADMAIAPFVRQFASVDASWFASQPWPQVRRWLATIVASARFQRVMRPVDAWIAGAPGIAFPFDH
ncbi:glutathione S-transferase [Povalibacter sp.]|uniref:glutathione S-transferase n=1 Tax=Povalibacter sp. TaxID=1962978 RepID=UPI002F42D696